MYSRISKLVYLSERRRSSWGKEKAIESQLAPLGIGIATNMNPEEMMDTFFVNNVQVRVYNIR